MTEDLDTLLTALYVEIDDHVAPPRQGRVRRPAADRRHAAAVWSPAGDGQPLGHRRNRRIRFCASHTRYYWGLKLYLVTAPDGMPVTWCMADPKLPRAGGLPGPADHRRRDRAGCPRRHGAGRQGLGRARRRTADRRARRAATAPGPPQRTAPAWQPRGRPTVDRVGVRHPQGPTRPGAPRGPHRA